VHEQLLHLLGAARWPARYLLQHPGVIDELAGSQLLSERFVAADFERDLQLPPGLAALHPAKTTTKPCSTCCAGRTMPRLFRTLARDVEGRITVEQVADDLSRWPTACCASPPNGAGAPEATPPRHAAVRRIIGYGKLGGKELGYGSDLDIVFVFDDDDERAPEVYAAFVRKLINWLTVKTAEGDLFEIDTATAAQRQLRPAGHQLRRLCQVPATARQQHRLDLGTPGHDARPLRAGQRRPARRRRSHPAPVARTL
jgi:glutamate-ammonia-ligase adenylyltransferase